ncbi:MAG: threonine--tRNA ligase [Candidatus Dojkabacteria bacterium]|nr:MAG: threonine--tRNA ligase [Candidatus Dojkabacteria bacterium]
MNLLLSDYQLQRSTAAFLLGSVIVKMYPDAQLGSVGFTEEGFYYDIDLGGSDVSEYDLLSLEEEINQLIQKALIIRNIVKTKDEAREFFVVKEEAYKRERIEEIKGNRVAFTSMDDGAFLDLGKIEGVKSSKDAGVVKLLSISGAYWKGDENRPMLTRIFGVAFPTQEELELYFAYKEEMARRDHRVLAKRLNMYFSDQSVGAGLVIWQPRGAYIKQQLSRFITDIYLENGFMPLDTPHISSKVLFEHSGHLDYFKNKMYHGMKQPDNDQYYIKPMNCPMHLLVFGNKTRSYRELPWRVMEMGTVYRYEKHSELQGLLKTRGFTQDDCHAVVAREHFESELESQFHLILFVLRSFGLQDFEVVLHSKMPKKLQAENVSGEWDLAVSVLKNLVRKAGYAAKESSLPSMFYGPKIEVIVTDVVKRKRQVSSLQLDILSTKKLEITYTGKDGLQHTPFMIHRTILGSFERFIAILLEHTAGILPLWLQFEKIRFLPVNSKQEFYAETLQKKCREVGIHSTVDYSSEPIEGKIKQAEEDKIPYIVLVGEKEQKVEGVSVRVQGTGDIGLMRFDSFLASVQEEIATKSIKSLLV